MIEYDPLEEFRDPQTYDLEDEEETFMYRVAFEYLVRGSLDPAHSRALISATTDEVWA